MQNHVRNTMRFRKSSCNKGLQSYGHFCAQVQSKNTEKDRKLKDFHFPSICEEGESPRTLRRLGPSKLEFYSEYNGSKYILIAQVLL